MQTQPTDILNKEPLRVLYNKDKDRNVDVLSVLQKRQYAGKERAAKKQRTGTAPVTVTQSSNTNTTKRIQRKLQAKHTAQLEKIHKFYTTEIASLQSAWEEERGDLDDVINTQQFKINEVNHFKNIEKQILTSILSSLNE